MWLFSLNLNTEVPHFNWNGKYLSWITSVWGNVLHMISWGAEVFPQCQELHFHVRSLSSLLCSNHSEPSKDLQLWALTLRGCSTSGLFLHLVRSQMRFWELRFSLITFFTIVEKGKTFVFQCSISKRPWLLCNGWWGCWLPVAGLFSQVLRFLTSPGYNPCWSKISPFWIILIPPLLALLDTDRAQYLQYITKCPFKDCSLTKMLPFIQYIYPLSLVRGLFVCVQLWSARVLWNIMVYLSVVGSLLLTCETLWHLL